MRFTNILLILIVGIVVIGSPISAFGCRTLAPDLSREIEPPCDNAIVIDLSIPGVVNFLDFKPTVIAFVMLSAFTWVMGRNMLPIPKGYQFAPLLPPPR